MMASGRVREVTLSSSGIHVALSGPMRENTGDRKSAREVSAESPKLHWPSLLRVVDILLADVISASPQGTMGMAKQSHICETWTVPLSSGSFEAREVLEIIENVRSAQTISVPF